MAERHETPETKGAVIHWAARYDLLVQLLTLGREGVFRDKVLRLARLTPGQSVLDVGCGTGTLAIAAKKTVGPGGAVQGIDPSPEMIARARKKAEKAGVEVTFTTAVAEALPCPDAQFDVVLASMMIHHLPRDVRLQGFREMRRVLKPGGRLLAVDFGGPERKRRGLIAHFHRHVHFDLHDVVPLLSEAGLDRVESGAVGFGSLQFVRAAALNAVRTSVCIVALCVASAAALAEDPAPPQTKFEVSPAIKRIQLFGDLRLRYESRAASSTFPIAEVGGADAEQLDRWRYSARVGIRGELTDRWSYGLRLETSANPRSAWVTFGNTNDNSAGGAAPYGEVGIFLGQAYLGWKATPWLTLQGGKMPNPMFTTPLVWDTDINPEGLTEKLNFELDDGLSVFANFAQLVYSQFEPNDDSGSLGFASHEGYQFALQAGVSTKFGARKSAKVALGYYFYSGFGAPDFAGDPNNNPSSSGFAGPFANGPENTLPNTPAGLAFANGLNGLRYLEVPWEVYFPIGSVDASVFGDWTYNTQADQRAAAGSYAFLGNQGTAYQLGFSAGTNLGLVLNQATGKKRTWEARAYWQSIELNALDTNIIEADFFEGRTNMQGFSLGFVYCATDAILVALRLGDAHRANDGGPTPGSNPDLADVQPIDGYKLLQLDVGWKF